MKSSIKSFQNNSILSRPIGWMIIFGILLIFLFTFGVGYAQIKIDAWRSAE